MEPFNVVVGVVTMAGVAFTIWWAVRNESKNRDQGGNGGDGGSGEIIGGDGVIIAGRGGAGGAPGAGNGGRGGIGRIVGGSGLIVGGDGGEAGQVARGGRGARSALERIGLGDITLPDGRKLSEFGRGGYGAAPPIQHQGRHYALGEVIKDLPDQIVADVDACRPRTSQEWWDIFANRHPDLASAAIKRTTPLRSIE